MWKKYIEWEKSNPLETEEYAQFAKRGKLLLCYDIVCVIVVYAYEQALLCLGYYPDVWHEASQFLQEASKKLEAKGDVKTSQQFTAETIRKASSFVIGCFRTLRTCYQWSYERFSSYLFCLC